MPSCRSLFSAASLLFAARRVCASPKSDAATLIATRSYNVSVALTFDPHNIPKDCQPICAYLSSLFTDNPLCNDNTCLCTNGFIREYGLCVDCALDQIAQSNGSTVPAISAQATLDRFVSDCNKTGLPVQSYTLAKNAATSLSRQGFGMGLTALVLGAALLVWIPSSSA